MRCSTLLTAALTPALATFTCGVHAETAAAEEVTITAALRPTALQDAPSSVTVLDSSTLHDAGQQHFQDVLNLVPNLNWSAGTSRPRYFQIRGIGELDQYQGAPNPSVGFLIDDIDFSGLGGLATLFDVEQIEVLRDPQSTSFGANALAGLIKVKTNDPRPHYDFIGEASWGNYGTRSVGGAFGGPLNLAGGDSAYRLVAQRYRSNGFRYNDYTGRSDTNGFNELTTRGKLRLDLGTWQLNLTGLYVDQDNGYDAWSIDNSFITHSDHPGRDAQRAKAAAANLQYDGWSNATFASITTYSAVDVVYSYDADWGNNPFWTQIAGAGSSPYDYWSDTTRRRITRTQEFRFSSKDVTPRAGRLGWIAGVYARNLREDNDDVEFGQYVDAGSTAELISHYEATNVAGYGQLEYDFTPATTLNVGLRFERRNAAYEDNNTPHSPTRENLIGGNVALIHRYGPSHSVHLQLARGYKAGGVNIGAEVPEGHRFFGAEYLWDLELGDRGEWLDGRFITDVNAFYMRRRDMQVSSSMQDPGNPNKFVFLTGNATSGENYGVEASAAYRLSAQWKLFTTASWLHTRFIEYQYVDKSTGVLHVLDGRAQAHAPDYQFSVGADWHHAEGWMGRIDVTGKDRFYFETSSNEQSPGYALVNLKLGYEQPQWAVYAWSRNVFDRRYATRGFFFADEPPDFIAKRYIQNGDPRQVGVTVSVNF